MKKRNLNGQDKAAPAGEPDLTDPAAERLLALDQGAPATALTVSQELPPPAENRLDDAGEPLDSLTAYLRNVRRTQLFTAREEFDMAGRASAGDFAARQSMIEHNLRLEVSMASLDVGRGEPRSDMLEEGGRGPAALQPRTNNG